VDRDQPVGPALEGDFESSSERPKQGLVGIVRSDPEPDQRAVLQHSDGPPVKIDAGRVDRKCCVDLLESQGRMGRILSPELVSAPDLSSPFEGRLGVELPELISRN